MMEHREGHDLERLSSPAFGQRSGEIFMRVAVLFLLLLAAVVRSIHAHDGAVEVAVEVNGDLHFSVDSEAPRPLQTATVESRDITALSSHAQDAASVKEHANVPHENTYVRASLLVMQKQLEVLDAMLALQAQKIHTLERMRSTLSEESSSSVGLQTLGFKHRQRTHAVPQFELEEAIDRKLDAITAQAITAASANHFDSHFVERAMVELPDDAVDINIGKIKAFPTHDVLVIGFRSGQVRILVASGQELLRIDTKVKGLSQLQLDLASEPPLLVVFASGYDAHVQVYALHFEYQATGSSPSRSAFTASELVLSQTALLNLQVRDSTAVVIARSPRRSVVGVARSDGSITFYALNGSHIHDVATGSTSISVMATQRHLVAHATGPSTFVFPMARTKVPESQHCLGSLTAVSSIAFDPVHPDVLFTGTVDGDVLAFLLTAPDPHSQSRQCTLVHRSIVRRGDAVQIAVFKGHLLAASSTHVTLFSVTRTGEEVALSRLSAKGSEAPHTNITKRLAVAENGHTTIVALLYAAPGSGKLSLLVLQSLLSASASTVDSSSAWRGVTTIAMVAIALFTAQYFLRRQHATDTAGGNRSEAEQWRELLEKRRRDGPSSEFLGKGFRHPDRSAPSTEATAEYRGDPTMFNATINAFARAKTRKTHRGFDVEVDDPELRSKIAEARRQTLECSFDDDDDDEGIDAEY